MLHEETEECIRLQQVYMYMNNQLHKEVTTEQEGQSDVIRQAINQVGTQMDPVQQELEGPWVKVINKLVVEE